MTRHRKQGPRRAEWQKIYDAWRANDWRGDGLFAKIGAPEGLAPQGCYSARNRVKPFELVWCPDEEHRTVIASEWGEEPLDQYPYGPRRAVWLPIYEAWRDCHWQSRGLAKLIGPPNELPFDGFYKSQHRRGEHHLCWCWRAGGRCFSRLIARRPDGIEEPVVLAADGDDDDDDALKALLETAPVARRLRTPDGRLVMRTGRDGQRWVEIVYDAVRGSEMPRPVLLVAGRRAQQW